LKQQKGLRILVLELNDVDFVANDSDFELILNCINKEYPVGMTILSL
jgi:hypothetical protein